MHSLKIIQQNDFKVDTQKSFFFGILDGYWTGIILDMFAQKLDKLSIVNVLYHKYMKKHTVDELKTVRIINISF